MPARCACGHWLECRTDHLGRMSYDSHVCRVVFGDVAALRRVASNVARRVFRCRSCRVLHERMNRGPTTKTMLCLACYRRDYNARRRHNYKTIR